MTAMRRGVGLRRRPICLARAISAWAVMAACVGHAAAQDGGGKTTPPGNAKSGDKKGKEQLPPFPTGPREKEIAGKLGEGFKVRRTDHFFVMYNTNDEVLKEFIARIEATYASVHRFAVGCGITIKYPKEKLPVVFCDQFEEYSKVALKLGGAAAPKEAAGLYFPAANFSLFYDMANSDAVKAETDKAKRLNEEARAGGSPKERKNKRREANFILTQMERHQQNSNKSVVQHEVAHQLLHNFQVHRRDGLNPVWFVEGLATLFEPPPGARGAGYNVVNQYRLWRLREGDRSNALPELEALVKDPMMLRGSGETMDTGYAQAWGLTYFLAQKKKKEMLAYIDLVKKRPAKKAVTPAQEMADFEKCFGRLNDEFLSKWTEFLRKLPFRPPR